MVNGKRVIAVIPARGGSKGLPNKNIRPLCGKPLVAWSIEQALTSRHVDVVLVSTDSPEIADVARGHGAAVPFLRPAHLATDEAATFPVVEHALAHYRERKGLEFAYTALMEPTSPLREADDVDRMLEELDGNSAEADSIISLGEVHEHPSIMKRLAGKGWAPYAPELPQRTRRQDNVPAYFPYGVAYIAKTAALLDERTFYTQRSRAFVIKRYQHYEIDDAYDFVCVEAVMRHEWRLA